jgi:hypothetical protein
MGYLGRHDLFRRRDQHELEARLRAARPEPSQDLIRSIAARMAPRRASAPRLAFAGALTATMLAALASVGGVSYAANAAVSAAKVVKKVVAPSGQQAAISVSGISSGGDQYRPGYGFGDRNHNHTGPPGLRRRGGEAAPPARARTLAGGKAKTVSFTVQLDEQAALRIHVLSPDGEPLLLTQKGSKVGAGIDGKQTKTIRYTVRVPRAIPITLRIPANLVTAGRQYRVRVVATDPDGNRSELLIPFIG